MYIACPPGSGIASLPNSDRFLTLPRWACSKRRPRQVTYPLRLLTASRFCEGIPLGEPSRAVLHTVETFWDHQ
jgi:hypothetical protein